MPIPSNVEGPLAEYSGQLMPHIQRIMDALSTVYPPLAYPPTGPREAPRQPYQREKWVLGSATAPDGAKQANPPQGGNYYVGWRYPSNMDAPQVIYWVPPGEGECRYVASGDTTGTSRGPTATADWTSDREYPEGSEALNYPFSRTGMLIQPWTVWIWGNSWADTELLQSWFVSKAHDKEHSIPEKFGEQFTATNGGWVQDRPGDRGLIWKLKINLVTPIVRQIGNRSLVRSFTTRETVNSQPALVE